MKTFEIVRRNGSRHQVLLDDEDFHFALERVWRVQKTLHVVSGTHPHTVLLHRLLLGAPAGSEVDHINHNPLDNRKENLRLCNHAENMKNRTRQVNNSTGYKGVWKKNTNGKFGSVIKFRGSNIFLGYHVTPESAALAYNLAAIRLYGSFANLNSIPSNTKLDCRFWHRRIKKIRERS